MNNITGITGPRGPLGTQGFKGPIGITGITGPTGDIGVAGLQGVMGLNGRQGTTGPMGKTGPMGVTGSIGITGQTNINFNLKANLESPTFTGIVNGITSNMISDNNVVINNNTNQDYNINNLNNGTTIFTASNQSVLNSPNLGKGFNSGCYELCVIGNFIYIGGNFTTVTNSDGSILNVNYVCKYDTVNNIFSALGNGLDSTCFGMCSLGNDIYIGGSFTTATNSDGSIINSSYVCKYDIVNNVFRALGNGLVGSGLSRNCNSLCVIGNYLYIGGTFISASNINSTSVISKNICKYDTVNNIFYQVGNGLNSDCLCMYAIGYDLYIGGAFTTVTNSDGNIINADRICKYDTINNVFLNLGFGFNKNCYAINSVTTETGIQLYMGGNFSTVTDSNNIVMPMNNICKYDINLNQIYPLGAGLNSYCTFIYCLNTDLYFGGYFTSADNIPANRICKYDTIKNVFSTLGSGFNSFTSNMCALTNQSGICLYIGGYFTTLNNVHVNYICKYTGINLFYNNTFLTSINNNNPYEIVKNNNIDNKNYISLLGNNNSLII